LIWRTNDFRFYQVPDNNLVQVAMATKIWKLNIKLTITRITYQTYSTVDNSAPITVFDLPLSLKCIPDSTCAAVAA